jgi:hypothetical protein
MHLNHLLYRHSHQLRRYAFASVLFTSGEHGNVASHWTTAVWLQLTHDHPNQVAWAVKCLLQISIGRELILRLGIP